MSVFSITNCKLSYFFGGMQTDPIHFSICSQPLRFFQFDFDIIHYK